MHVLTQSWQRTWQHLGLKSPEALFEQLIAAYNEPQRHYHTLQHLQECIAHFDAFEEASDEAACAYLPGAISLALWFHDAVYDVKGKDNEAQSAHCARIALEQANAPLAIQERVHALIMATCHATEPQGAEERLLVDIDLAILGAAPSRFAQYDQQVRQEYQWVPEAIYMQKRQEVLKAFLDREKIFHTPYFFNRYEQQARCNLLPMIYEGILANP